MMIKQMVKVTFLVTVFMILFHGITLAGTVKYTVGGHAAALTEELLDKVVSLSVAKDYQALQKLLDSKMVIILKKGLKVEVVDTKLFSGQIKIRPFGTNIELWTITEAITNTKVKDTGNAVEETTEKKVKKSDGLYSLNVNATPSDSTIKIMNITPKYESGINLKSGKYDVLVTKNGYKEWREWVKIVDSNLSIDVSLEENKNINAERVTKSSARKQVFKRCKSQMGEHGTSIVKACIDQDMEAVVAINKYPDKYNSIVNRCMKQMREHGFSIVKACVDQDIEATIAINKYPDKYSSIVNRCMKQMREHGFSIVKACVDQDIEAEKALSNY